MTFAAEITVMFCGRRGRQGVIELDFSAATVSSAPGHSNITTTTSIYCHAFQEVQARIGNAIAAALNLSGDGNPEQKNAV